MRKDWVCVDCGGAPMFGAHRGDLRCSRCSSIYYICMRYGRGQVQANQEANRAIMRGLLRRAADQICVDCGAPGEHLDHRDYNRPLDVEPVCRSCNGKRGPAKPKAWSFDEFWEDFRWRKSYAHLNLTPDDFVHVATKFWPPGRCGGQAHSM